MAVHRLGIMSGLDEHWDGWQDDEREAEEDAKAPGPRDCSAPSQAAGKDSDAASSCAGSVGAPRRWTAALHFICCCMSLP